MRNSTVIACLICCAALFFPCQRGLLAQENGRILLNRSKLGYYKQIVSGVSALDRQGRILYHSTENNLTPINDSDGRPSLDATLNYIERKITENWPKPFEQDCYRRRVTGITFEWKSPVLRFEVETTYNVTCEATRVYSDGSVVLKRTDIDFSRSLSRAEVSKGSFSFVCEADCITERVLLDGNRMYKYDFIRRRASPLKINSNTEDARLTNAFRNLYSYVPKKSKELFD